MCIRDSKQALSFTDRANNRGTTYLPYAFCTRHSMHVTCAHVFAYYNFHQNISRATLTSPPHSLHQPPLLFSSFTEISLSFLACKYFAILYILARKRWDCQEDFTEATQSKDFLTTYVVLPSGISGFCSKIEHLTDFNLSVAASIVILML